MTETTRARISEIAAPVTAFCGEEAVARAFEFVAPDDMPEPYRGLLVHSDDMTGTLERYRGQKMTLHTIECIANDERLTRHVELRGETDGIPAEFGAIEIHLDRFAADARSCVLEGYVPLGAILKEAAMEFISRPLAYFRIQPEDALRTSFGVPEDGWLYGRCNQLLTPDGAAIAEVVEILPPGLPE